MVYSDGLSEAMDERGTQFGVDRLRLDISGSLHEPQAMLSGVLRSVHEFLGARGSTTT